MDVDSPIKMDWTVTRGNLHDSSASHDLIDTVRYFSYILADSAYDTSGYMTTSSRTHILFL